MHHVVAHAPVAADSPVAVDSPVAADSPVVTDFSVDSAVVTHVPVVAHAPVVGQAPVVAHAAVVVHAPVVTPPTWPTETDIIFLPGSNKVLLTVQRPIMRLVIQEAMEWTRANIMCGNAFPDVIDTLEYIRDALSAAAEENVQAGDIHRRIVADHAYFINMSRLVSFSY